MTPKLEEFWLPALKPVRSPWLARLGIRPIPCVHSTRRAAYVLLPAQEVVTTPDDKLKDVLALLLLPM